MQNNQIDTHLAEEDSAPSIYLVCAFEEWEHYDPDHCPKPIQEWITQHYPDVAIDAFPEFNNALVTNTDHPNCGPLKPDDFPAPRFRLGFTADQAAHFYADWSAPERQTIDGRNDFLFMICTQISPTPYRSAD